MTSERWHQIEILFEQALERPPATWTAFLADTCPDPDLRGEVAELLEAHRHPGLLDRLADVLATPLAALTADAPAGPSAEGRRVGPYRIKRLLGRGGMGAVYLADRVDGAYEQRVALKLVREGLDDEALHTRFLHERQTLARLQHPGIARLLGGGLTDEGHPYFAMEYVEGAPFDAYCDAHRLSVSARLHLFAEVCEAVHHAHQHLVVHRDLKPSNILVAERGSAGGAQVKLLDFGIAKLMRSSEAELFEGPVSGSPQGTDLTRTTRMLTPEFAAPEQLRGEPITTATDVYSLGVLLYLLLTGHRPYAVRGLSPAALEHVICEATPPRPSAAVGASDAGTSAPEMSTPDAIAAARSTEPDALVRRLVGDLDTIVLKAMEKDPGRRYPSAEALLEDVRRHLKGLPVRARPATLGYRVGSFVRRHRPAVAAAVLVVLSLIGGLVGTAWQAGEAARERDRAQVEAAKAEEALDFLVALFESSDPNEAQGDSVTAREILDRGAQRLDALDQTTVKATLFDAVGRVYQSLGLLHDADSLLARALVIRRAEPDVPPRRLAASLYHLGTLRADQSAYAAADSLFREALALLGPAAEPRADVAAAEHALGGVLSEQGRYDEAEPFLRRALATRRALHDASHPDVQAAQRSLFLVLHRRGDFEAAETLFREAVQHSRATPGRVDQATIDHYLGLAHLLARFRHDYAGAEVVLREALPLATAQFGPDHPNTASIHNELALALLEAGENERAERHARAAMAIWLDRFGAEHRATSVAKATLSQVRRRQGALDEAEALRRDALGTLEQLFGPGHLAVLSAQLHLAAILHERGEMVEAEALLRRAIDESRAGFGDDHPHVARGLQGLGLIRQAEGDSEAATEFFRQALALREGRHAPGHWRIAEAQRLFASGLIDAGRIAEAEALLSAALPVLEGTLGPDAPETKRATAALARLDSVRVRPGGQGAWAR